MLSASKLFDDRHRGQLPEISKTKLDTFQNEFKSMKPELILIAWDNLQLNKGKQVRANEWPESEDDFQSLKRKLMEMSSKEAAKRNTNKVLSQTSVETVTPPPRNRADKRLDSEISNVITPANQQIAKKAYLLAMERLPAIAPWQGPAFSLDKDKPEASIELSAASPWTALGWNGDQSYTHRYMHAPLKGLTELLRARITEFGQDLLESGRVRMPVSTSTEAAEDKPKEEEEEEKVVEFDKVGASVQGRNVLVCGRIVCEGENEKLALGNCMLEGVNGVRVKLEFADLATKFSIFPGQYLVVEGASTGRGKLQVNELYSHAPMQVVTTPPVAPRQGLSMWVVSGPFTNHLDLKFDLLSTLLAQVKREEPQVCRFGCMFERCNTFILHTTNNDV
jgi:hypothetical protein